MEIPLRFARNPGADFPRNAVAVAVVAGGGSFVSRMQNSRGPRPRLQHRFNPLTLRRLILFAFVFLRGNNAIFNRVGVHRDTNPVKHRQAQTEPRAGDGSESRESQHNQGTDGEQEPNAAVTFINVAEPRHDAEQRRHRIARSALRRLFSFPVTLVTGIRACWQPLAAIRTQHYVRRLSRRGVGVFHRIK